MDRRVLILICSAICALGAIIGTLFTANYTMLLVAAFLIGGMSNPLYSLLIAYTNDFLEHDDMAAASGGLLFINGLGAVAGPVITGWMMSVFGPRGFFILIAILTIAMVIYAAYRMTQRKAPAVADTDSFTAVMASSSPMAVTFAQEYDIDVAQEDADQRNQ